MDLNPSQASAIRHKEGPMLVLAGPGSGKTLVITERTRYLIEECHISPSNILVITFTKAAATEMKERFIDVMEQLDANFKVTFRELFGGGTAELRLTDREDPLGCGIEINVAPPGKIVKSMSLLSGGEQSFVAIALFFAILSVNPTPFAVLDEIEAALDDVNVARFADYIKRYSGDTQFVVITHRRGTMEIADTLYGVTMPERGISRVLTLNITEVENRLGVKIN